MLNVSFRKIYIIYKYILREPQSTSGKQMHTLAEQFRALSLPALMRPLQRKLSGSFPYHFQGHSEYQSYP
jgi:hypothetical protein